MNDKPIIGYEIYLAGKSLRPITRKNYIKIAKNFLQYTGKNPDELTQDDVNQYIRYHIKTNTHNGNATRFRTLKYYMDYLGKDFEIPMFSHKEVDKAVLNNEETKKLFDTIKTMSYRHQLVFYLEYDGIRRPREICDLNYRHRDILYYNGKTHNDHIIMTERLMTAWDNYVTYERPEPQQPIHAPYLLLNVNNNPGLRGTHLRTTHPIIRIIKEIAYKAEIDIPMGENPTNYLIKRTSITRQLKTCPDPKIIQLQAGHANLSQTMTYNRVSDDDRRNYFQKLGKDYRRSPYPKNTHVVLKSSGDLPQDLNKINGGELKNDNASFSFSVSFFNNCFGTEKADGNFSHHIFTSDHCLECFFSHLLPICQGLGGVFFE